VSDAKVVLSDPRAVDTATSVISPVYNLPTTVDCDILVQDFCLTSMTETAEAGRWAFTFNLDVTSNDACGQLTANMDIMADGEFLTGVTLPQDEIVDALECDCLKTVTVVADFDGAEGAFFGQLDVRNDEHDVVKILDSCEYDFEA